MGFSREAPGQFTVSLVDRALAEALFAAGLEKQLKRTDLPAPVRATLVDAQAKLWRAIAATRAAADQGKDWTRLRRRPDARRA